MKWLIIYFNEFENYKGFLFASNCWQYSLSGNYWLALQLLIIYFLVFMIGASWCGFFQCMLYRLSHKINLFQRRSFCDFCGVQLGLIDPVPVINYLVLRGQCRFCKTKLPRKYFLTELISGIIFLMLMFLPFNLLIILPLALVLILGLSCVTYLKEFHKS